MTNALTKSTPRQLTRVQLQQLSTYTDPATILASLKTAGWTIKKCIENLVEIANECDKDSTRLAANKYLCQLVTDCMERSGMMVIATKKTYGEDGEEVTFTGHIVSSSLQGQDEHTSIEELEGDDSPNDIKETEDDKKTKTTRKPKKTGGRTAAKTGDQSGKGAGDRPERDGDTSTKQRGNTSQTGGSSGKGVQRVQSKRTGYTEAGLSDDLHTSKAPELHLDSFKGLAVPPESTVPGAADTARQQQVKGALERILVPDSPSSTI